MSQSDVNHPSKHTSGNHKSIQQRFTVALVLFGTTITALSIVIALNAFKEQLTLNTHDHLKSVAEVQQQRVSNLLTRLDERTTQIASRTQLRLSLDQHNQQPSDRHTSKITRIIRDAQRPIPSILEISVIDVNGATIASTVAERVGQSAHMPHHAMINIDGSDDRHIHLHMHRPLILDGKTIGAVHIINRISELEEITSNYTGLGQSGETLIAERLENGDAPLVSQRLIE